MSERIPDIARTQLANEVDNITTFIEAVVIPKLLLGIYFERRSCVAVTYGAGIPEMTATVPRFGRFDTLALQVEVNRNGSGLR